MFIVILSLLGEGNGLLVQDLLNQGCIRVKPNLIWNRLGVLVPSCEECLDHKCVNQGIRCPSCRSRNVRRKGRYRRRVKYLGFPSFNADRQVFYCLDCGRTFIEKREHLKSKTPQQVIDFALRQIQKGNSLRRVSKMIEKEHSIKRSPVTIAKWLRSRTPENQVF